MFEYAMIGIAYSLLVLGLLPSLIIAIYGRRLKVANVSRRLKLLEDLNVSASQRKVIVGFFHPYCNAGGGGERVLWAAIAFIQRTKPDIVSVVYTGDVNVTKDQIISGVKSRFNIVLNPQSLSFIYLKSRYLVEDSFWTRFTLLGQSLGSMILAWEAMSKLIPDLYIDTMGYAFTFHVVRWLGNIPIGAYVHYPTISTDMLARVRSRTKWHTNSDSVSSSSILSRVKLLYYRIFMYYYAQSLRKALFMMVNSSWTKNHVDSILQHTDILMDAIHLINPFTLITLLIGEPKGPKFAQIVYPPCETQDMVSFAIENRERVILSVAQFRPEKDHIAQLRSFNNLLTQHPEYKSGDAAVKLVLIGGCRNDDDAARVDSLRALAKELGISDCVEFIINASYPTMLSWQARASIGLSTMVDEHFGINIVEFMAAGVIPVTHASGGPLNDIVVPYNGQPTGYHATDPGSFAAALNTALSLSKDEDIALRSRARTWAVHRFSREEFEKAWQESGWRHFLPKT